MKLIIKSPIHYVFLYYEGMPPDEIQRVSEYYLSIEEVLHQFKIYGQTSVCSDGVIIIIEPQVVSINEYNMQILLSKAIGELCSFKLAYAPAASVHGEVALEIVDVQRRDTSSGDSAF